MKNINKHLRKSKMSMMMEISEIMKILFSKNDFPSDRFMFILRF